MPAKPESPPGTAPESPAESPAAADLQAHLAALRAEVAALARLVAETAEARARDTLKGLAVAGAEPIGEAKEEVLKAMDKARVYANEKPLHALGMAAGAGLILGLLIGRR